VRNKSYYLELRNGYTPKVAKIIFVLESPPVGGNYFYDASGSIGEPLYRSMMLCVMGKEFKTKSAGLEAFSKAGYLLVDATYTSVNQMSDSERNAVIVGDYNLLVEDLNSVSKNKKAKIVLIKANICRLLRNRLSLDNFSVLNIEKDIIPFPSNGWQNVFCKKIASLLSKSK
jgi:hypothetical protein